MARVCVLRPQNDAFKRHFPDEIIFTQRFALRSSNHAVKCWQADKWMMIPGTCWLLLPVPLRRCCVWKFSRGTTMISPGLFKVFRRLSSPQREAFPPPQTKSASWNYPSRTNREQRGSESESIQVWHGFRTDNHCGHALWQWGPSADTGPAPFCPYMDCSPRKRGCPAPSRCALCSGRAAGKLPVFSWPFFIFFTSAALKSTRKAFLCDFVKLQSAVKSACVKRQITYDLC